MLGGDEVILAKACSLCGVVKSLNGFGVDRQKVDFLTSQCKACRRLNGRRNNAAFRERNRDHYLVYQRAWSKKNKEKRKAQQAARITPEQRREYQNRWNRANPEKRAARKAKRRALEAGAQGTHTAQDIKSLKRLQRNKCAACKTPLTRYHVDHVLALAAGGSNDRKNLQLLCPTCNLSKGDRHPITFMQEKGYLL